MVEMRNRVLARPHPNPLLQPRENPRPRWWQSDACRCSGAMDGISRSNKHGGARRNVQPRPVTLPLLGERADVKQNHLCFAEFLTRRNFERSCARGRAHSGSVYFRPIPTGLCPPAQGCAARATLGKIYEMNLNPNGVASCSLRIRHNPVGVGVFCDIEPRVARGAQPWALGRNPVGIQEQHRPAGAGESCASVLDRGGPPPIFQPLRRCESARALAQSKTSRQALNLGSAGHCPASSLGFHFHTRFL